MAADRPFQVSDVRDALAHRISPGDLVKLAVLRRPDEGYDASVLFEVWEPGGAQPPNMHPGSVETFLFLSGEGLAHCDDQVTPVRAGQLLVLPPRSTHRIENTGAGRLYAITTMTPDAGFADLVEAGPAEPLEAADLQVLAGATSPEGPGGEGQ